MHDIGRTPFSHALEKIVLENSRTVVKVKGKLYEKNLVDKLSKKIYVLEGKSEKIGKIDAASHEKIGSIAMMECS